MRIRLTRTLAVALCLLPGLVGAHAAAPALAAAPLIKTAPAPILVTGQGMTLYVYTLDKFGLSFCNSGCEENWPPLLVPKGTTAPSKLLGVDGTFGVITRYDGTKQLTYQGAPLYTRTRDTAPGDMTGQGIKGLWWVAGAQVAASDIPPQASSDTSVLVKTATAQILVNAQGRTVYFLTSDPRYQSVCYGGCARAWPALLVPSDTQPPATIPGVAGTFAVTQRIDGKRQLTYDGFPLYNWFRDSAPGDVTGEGVGGIWWDIATGAAPGQ